MSRHGIDLNGLAPVVVTVYNRPWHTEQTLKALRANDLAARSILYVYSDGPKHLASAEDLERISKVRGLIRAEKWCGEVRIVEAARNLGLVRSFVKAVTEVVNEHGRVIVLEDDQITSRGFLSYMNEALELYEDDPAVMHVSGYMYPAQFTSKATTFFLRVQSCPGWGTWKRAWAHYNHDAADHLAYFGQTKERRRKFDIEGHAYFFRQLERNAGPVEYSFAVRWYASCLRAGGLSLFPAKSLVKNIGLDGTGVHCPASSMYDVETVDYLDIERRPLVEDRQIRRSVDSFYKENIRRGPNWSPRRVASATLRACGAPRMRRGLRWLLTKIVPELAVLGAPGTNLDVVRAIVARSSVSPKARLYPPYRVVESSIGDFSYLSENARVSFTDIGRFCSIGPNLLCGWGVHPTDAVSTSPMFYSTMKQNGTTLSGTDKVLERRRVRIGNDVFVGMNVTVLDGVTIGDGAVIGAGAVVSKDIPPYAIAVGSPIQVIRYRFSENEISRLMETRWWDWPDEDLAKVEEHLLDVGEFLERYGKK